MKPAIMICTLLLAAFLAGFWWDKDSAADDKVYITLENPNHPTVDELLSGKNPLKECQEELDLCKEEVATLNAYIDSSYEKTNKAQ